MTTTAEELETQQHPRQQVHNNHNRPRTREELIQRRKQEFEQQAKNSSTRNHSHHTHVSAWSINKNHIEPSALLVKRERDYRLAEKPNNIPKKIVIQSTDHNNEEQQQLCDNETNETTTQQQMVFEKIPLWKTPYFYNERSQLASMSVPMYSSLTKNKVFNPSFAHMRSLYSKTSSKDTTTESNTTSTTTMNKENQNTNKNTSQNNSGKPNRVPTRETSDFDPEMYLFKPLQLNDENPNRNAGNQSRPGSAPAGVYHHRSNNNNNKMMMMEDDLLSDIGSISSSQLSDCSSQYSNFSTSTTVAQVISTNRVKETTTTTNTRSSNSRSATPRTWSSFSQHHGNNQTGLKTSTMTTAAQKRPQSASYSTLYHTALVSNNKNDDRDRSVIASGRRSMNPTPTQQQQPSTNSHTKRPQSAGPVISRSAVNQIPLQQQNTTETFLTTKTGTTTSHSSSGSSNTIRRPMSARIYRSNNYSKSIAQGGSTVVVPPSVSLPSRPVTPGTTSRNLTREISSRSDKALPSSNNKLAVKDFEALLKTQDIDESEEQPQQTVQKAQPLQRQTIQTVKKNVPTATVITTVTSRVSNESFRHVPIQPENYNDNNNSNHNKSSQK